MLIQLIDLIIPIILMGWCYSHFSKEKVSKVCLRSHTF